MVSPPALDVPSGDSWRPPRPLTMRPGQRDDGDGRLRLASRDRRGWHGTVGTRVARQVQPRRCVGTVGVGSAADEFADPAVGLVAETDPVDQPPLHRSVAQQRRLLCQGVDVGGVDVPRLGDRSHHLGVQALDQPAVRFAMGVGVCVLR